MTAEMIRKVGPGEQVGGEGQVAGTGDQGYIPSLLFDISSLLDSHSFSSAILQAVPKLLFLLRGARSEERGASRHL